MASTAAVQEPRLKAFQLGLQELGCTDGKNITLEYRDADGKPERLPELAADLIRLKVSDGSTSLTTGFGFWIEVQEHKRMNRFPSKSFSDNRKSAIQKRPRGPKLVGIVALVITFAMCGVEVPAQQRVKIARIGFLAGVSPATISARTQAFREGLRELGYVEGKNLLIEWRYAEEKPDRLNDLAAELVRLKVEVIVSAAPAATLPLKEATKTVPIVMTFDDDPVGNGFVASLARPGGNITGLSNQSPEISGKQLELLKEILPRLARVAVFGSSTRPGNTQSLKETELAAGAFGVKVQYSDVQNSKDIETAFRAASKGRADAVVVFGGTVVNSHRKQLADLAAKSRLPAIYPRSEFVEAGGLMTYGPSINDQYRRAATYVDKILKGAKPGDLPVEQPKKFEFFINLKAAKQIGLTIPPNVLARADRVIR